MLRDWPQKLPVREKNLGTITHTTGPLFDDASNRHLALSFETALADTHV